MYKDPRPTNPLSNYARTRKADAVHGPTIMVHLWCSRGAQLVHPGFGATACARAGSHENPGARFGDFGAGLGGMFGTCFARCWYIFGVLLVHYSCHVGAAEDTPHMAMREWMG